MYRVDGKYSYNHIRANPLLMAREGLKFLFGRRGVLASGPSMAGGFARTNPALEVPDIQLHFNPVSGDRPGHFHDFAGCTPIISQLRPESRGGMRIFDQQQHLECKPLLSGSIDRYSALERIPVPASMPAVFDRTPIARKA